MTASQRPHIFTRCCAAALATLAVVLFLRPESPPVRIRIEGTRITDAQTRDQVSGFRIVDIDEPTIAHFISVAFTNDAERTSRHPQRVTLEREHRSFISRARLLLGLGSDERYFLYVRGDYDPDFASTTNSDQAATYVLHEHRGNTK